MVEEQTDFDASTTERERFPIVGVGASAGGLEALEALFSATPEDSGVAFVVLQHLSPDFESRMDELLARRTRIPIQKVTDGIEVEPNHIYLIPPRKEMILSGCKLLLTDKDPESGLTLPIDRFLRSLAQDAGAQSIAVILSGTGSDGSRGIKDVHAAGGLVVCQTPETARFDGMPRSTLDTGLVHLTLPPAAIPDAIVRYVREELTAAQAAIPRHALSSEERGLERVLLLLRSQHGIDFGHYKTNTVSRRLERRVAMAQLPDLESYIRQLEGDPGELNALYHDLLIGVTQFFRDPEAFDYLQARVVPELVDRPDELRIWVPGCATGEEVYSLAILFREALGDRGARPGVKIFATDLHAGSLEMAGLGVFGEEALAGVSSARRERFFTRVGDRYRVSKELREMVVFARHNVISDAPFTRLDLVSCRNLLIYLKPATQQKTISLFHFGLKAGGVLFLGPSETPGDLSDEFEPIQAHWKVYRKRRDVRLSTGLRLTSHVSPTVARPAHGGRRQVDALLLAAYDHVMERHVPPAFLVDHTGTLLHAFAGAEELLSLPRGRASTLLLDLAPEGLRAALSGALQQAQSRGGAVTMRGVPVRVRGEELRVELTVEPLHDKRLDAAFYLVTVRKTDASAAGAAVVQVDASTATQDYVATLEHDLRSTKENLQATIEELETSNEELQAANEELVAANEELQSTNEELHSVNEELHSVNFEHQRKIDELTELTDDMDNLLRSTEIGVLFLDDQLRVRKFTARMEVIFHLLPQDVGRSFDNFASSLEHPHLMEDLRAVASTRASVEREVRTKSGELFLLRVLPYRSRTEPEGVVMTLVDIASLRHAESEARRLSDLVRSSREAIISKGLDGTILSWNEGAKLLFGYDEAEAVGKNIGLLIPESAREEERLLRARVVAGSSAEILETQRLTRSGQVIDTEISLSPILDAEGRVVGLSSIVRNITERRRATEAVKRAIAQRDQFMALLSHELRNPLMGLTSAASLLERAGANEQARKRAQGVIRRQVHQMARLLEDLLDASRMRHDKLELERRRIDLRDTVAGVLDVVQPRADGAGIRLAVSTPEQPIPVSVDASRLTQVQVNLLDNAIRFSHPGGRVRYSMRSEGGFAVVSVEDEGAGMSPEIVPHVFEPFFQGELRGHGGMGLGLSLAEAVARAHGGSVSAFSEGKGRGARFEVRVPLADGTPEAVQATSAAPSPPRGRRAILVVDDDEDARQTLAALLEDAGHPVLQASTGLEGVALAAELPAAAIVDVGLPDIDGLEVARRIRARVDGAGVRLIALTGFGQQKDRKAAERAGFDLHLVKPIDFDTLQQALSGLLEAPPSR